MLAPHKTPTTCRFPNTAHLWAENNVIFSAFGHLLFYSRTLNYHYSKHCTQFTHNDINLHDCTRGNIYKALHSL